MPELPEVETIRRDLRHKILYKKIIGVQILHKKTVHNKEKDFWRILKNNKIKEIDRAGKLIIFELAGKNFLLAHLKMTGQLIYVKNNEITVGGHSETKTNLNLPNKHTRVIISFADKAKLFFNDLRLFGYMKIVDAKAKNKIKLGFGIEPLTANFTLNNFAKIFKNRKTSLKAVLLNQKLIAGVGNIYADEACFAAGINPFKQANKLTKKEIKKLFLAIEKILKKAILKRGTTFNNYVDSDGNKGNYIKYLKVYGRGGKSCNQCQNILKKKKLAGRSTVFCVDCQK